MYVSTTKNFLDNPDRVIEFSKKLKYSKCSYYGNSSGIFSGLRAFNTDISLNEEILSKLQNNIDKSISYVNITFNLNSRNSCFGCPHTDYSDVEKFKYAGVVYLNKSAPKNTGTTLYSNFPTIEDYHSKMQILYSIDIPMKNAVKQEVAKEILKAKEQSKIIKKYENIYNNVIVYDTHTIHSGDLYFGTNKNNSRFTIAFFAK